MNKQEFLSRLRKGLEGLPKDEVQERVSFYSEMIDDRMEEGFSEEEAVKEIGSVEMIISQIKGDIPITKLVKEKITPKKSLKAWEIVLLVLGSPIWFSLLIATVAVVFSLYVVLWSVIISLWSVFGAFVGCAIGGIVSSVVLLLSGNIFIGMILMSAGLVCGGLSIFAFFGCKAITKGIILLTKKIGIAIKNCFVKKEEA